MQKKKIIIKSIINFFTKNLLSVFGMIMLVLFSSAVFTTLNNATNNLNSSYNRVTSKGNLHDFVINERFTLGDSDYALVGSGTYDPTNQTYSYTITPNTSTWTNSYAKISIDYQAWKANGELLDQFFSQNKFLFENNNYVASGFASAPSQTIIDNLVQESISDQLSQLEMLTTNYMPIRYIADVQNQTPTSLRNFKSINIPTNRQNTFYKVIESNRDNLIDKVVLFSGNNLSDTDKSFSGLFPFYSDLAGDISSYIPAGRKSVEMLLKVDWNSATRIKQYNAFNNFLKEKPNDKPWTVTAPLGLARNGQTNFKKL